MQGLNRAFLSAFIGVLLAQNALADELIVWNVGQGLWSTLVSEKECDHFDAGGEHAPWLMIEETCGHRKNFTEFSHWDWDHVGFALLLRKRLGDVCLAGWPGGEAPGKRANLMSGYIPCALSPKVIEVSAATPARKLTSNDSSRVYIADRNVLLPGDATAKAERFWQNRWLKSVRVLVLGHHGSKTSTSDVLLAKLPRVELAIASARKAKYGHPHQVVVDRLKRNGTAVLSTEDWGSIHIEIKRPGP